MDSLDSHDEVERLKTWWKEYGAAIIVGTVLGAALIVGVNYWKQHSSDRARAASALYEQLEEKFNQKKTEEAQAIGAQLMKDFDATPYAGRAALILAKLSFDANDLPSARSQLQWVIDHAEEPSARHLARLRLARLLLAQNEIEAARKLIDIENVDGFASAYQELKGDAARQQGKPEEARKAYRAARDALAQGSAYARTLDMKLADLGPEAAP